MRAYKNAKTVFLALILVAVPSCSKKPPQPASSASAQEGSAAVAQKDQKAPTQATHSADSGLVLSPGSFGGSRLYQSWPLILNATAWRKHPAKPEGVAPPTAIKAKSGAWSEALVVTVKNAGGEVVRWPLHLVRRDAGELTLDVDASATVEWWLAPEETQSLAEGDYAITVAFDTGRVEGLPTVADAIQSDGYHLQVVKEPVTLDPEQQQNKLFLTAWLSMMQDDMKGVEEKAGKMLALDPQSIGGRRLKAMLLTREGKNAEAVTMLDDALEIYSRKYPDADPPGGLMEERHKIMKSIKLTTVKSDKTTEEAARASKKK